MLKIENNLKILEQFEKYLKNSNKSINTINAYVKDVKDLLFFVVPKKIQSLTPLDISNFKKNLENQLLSNKTVSRKLNSVSRFCKFLVREKIINSNPFKNSIYPDIKLGKIKFLNKTELKHIYLAAKEEGDKQFILINLMILAGLKINEVKFLRIGDVKLDLNSGYIQVNSSGKFNRKIPLCEKLFFILSNYIHSNNLLSKPHKYLLTTSTGKSYDVRNLRSLIDKIFIETNILGYTVNDLRNSFIIWQLKSGCKSTVIAKVSGLTTKLSIQRYINAIAEFKDGELDKVVDIV